MKKTIEVTLDESDVENAIRDYVKKHKNLDIESFRFLTAARGNYDRGDAKEYVHKVYCNCNDNSENTKTESKRPEGYGIDPDFPDMPMTIDNYLTEQDIFIDRLQEKIKNYERRIKNLDKSIYYDDGRTVRLQFNLGDYNLLKKSLK